MFDRHIRHINLNHDKYPYNEISRKEESKKIKGEKYSKVYNDDWQWGKLYVQLCESLQTTKKHTIKNS